MRRFLLVLLGAAVLSAVPLFADTTIRDIDIDVVLSRDGSARITETWDISCSDITEWYLVRSNLGDIKVKDLEVSDETGRRFTNEGGWDIDRSISQKAYRCGIVDKGSRGCEICWGVGSNGKHIFTASYTMTNVVKSLNDYDMLHMQFISDELSSSPKHARVTISAPGYTMNEENCRIWGFGYEGTMTFEDGDAVAESSKSLGYSGSVIALVRFDKGFFESPSVQNKDFQEELDQALNGASWDDDEMSTGEALLGLLFTGVVIYAFFIYPIVSILRSASGKVSRREKRKFLGKNPKSIGWSRYIPFKGDLLQTDYILTAIGEDRKQNSIASALILQMLKDGQLTMRKDAKDKVEICFSDAPLPHDMSGPARDLFEMMKEASGEDVVLQDKEFSKWASSHKSKVRSWASSIKTEGKTRLALNRYLSGSKLTSSGQKEAQGVVGFKKYLEDFTIINERKTVEVALWQDYLAFAALYGIADKVAKELKDIDPTAFGEVITYDFDTYRDVVFMTRSLANAITNASYKPATSYSYGGGSRSYGGFGGHSSFGGGGGFSGGGHGGGGR